MLQAIDSEIKERKLLQAKLDETGDKLTSAELGKSQAKTEADDLKRALELQFTEQLAQYKVSASF